MTDRLRFLADETRYSVLSALESGPVYHCDLADATGASPDAIGYHLSLLCRFGCLNKTRRGRKVRYSLTPQARLALAAVRDLASVQRRRPRGKPVPTSQPTTN